MQSIGQDVARNLPRALAMVALALGGGCGNPIDPPVPTQISISPNHDVIL